MAIELRRGGGVSRPSRAQLEAPESTLDFQQVLGGLQRGSVPGADESVAFLCQKFSLLVDRLQRAEREEADNRDLCVARQSELATVEAEGERERAELEVSCRQAREESRLTEESLIEALHDESKVEVELENARCNQQSLQQRRGILEEQCSSERMQLAEANNRIRQWQAIRPAGQEDLRRLQGQVESLQSRCSAVTTEIKASQDRVLRHEIWAAELKSEALDEDDARCQSSEASAARREDLGVALSELGSLKERLAEVQVTMQTYEDQLARRIDSSCALRDSLQKREAWMASRGPRTEGLHIVAQGLERVLADAAETRTLLLIEETEAQQACVANRQKEGQLAELEERLCSQAVHLREVESEEAANRSEMEAAIAEQKQLDNCLDQLKHDQAASGGLRDGLLAELRILLSQLEQLKLERDAAASVGAELQQRLALVGPTLSEARGRARELESRLSVARAAEAHERQQNERLEREISVCQDKLALLHDENVRLREQCIEFEAQLAGLATARIACSGRKASLGRQVKSQQRGRGPRSDVAVAGFAGPGPPAQPAPRVVASSAACFAEGTSMSSMRGVQPRVAGIGATSAIGTTSRDEVDGVGTAPRRHSSAPNLSRIASSAAHVPATASGLDALDDAWFGDNTCRHYVGAIPESERDEAFVAGCKAGNVARNGFIGRENTAAADSHDDLLPVALTTPGTTRPYGGVPELPALKGVVGGCSGFTDPNGVADLGSETQRLRYLAAWVQSEQDRLGS